MADNEDPGFGPLAPGLTHAEAVRLANGVSAQNAALALAVGPPPGPMAVDVAAAVAFLASCVSSNPRVHYGLGAKIPSDASQPGSPAPPGFTAVDCSGFVRATLRRSTNPKTAMPDGSVVQHDWVKAHGFALGAVADGDATDGVVRIAFLPPSASPEGIGHVVLLHDGQTLESHGGVGPDRRLWNGLPWRNKTQVYRLT